MCGSMGSVHVIVARVSICTRDGCRPLDSRLRGNDGVGTGMKTVGTGMTRRDGRGGRCRLGGCGAGRPGEAGGDDWADVEPEGRERREAPIGRMWSRKDGRGGMHRLGGCGAGRTGEAGCTDWADVQPEGREGDFRYGGNVPFPSSRHVASGQSGGVEEVGERIRVRAACRVR